MKRTAVCFSLLAVTLLLLCFFSLVSGSVHVPFRDLLKAFTGPGGEDAASRILWNLRLPRLSAAVLSGCSLSVAGLSLQTVFRNPLCGPFVLGISSGASLGVALALIAGLGFGHLGVLGAATLGAVAVTAVVLGMSARFSRGAMLLVAGLMIGYFVDAMVSVLVASASAESLRIYVAWGFGSFGRLTLDGIWIFALAVLMGLSLVVCSLRYLNAAAMGDDFACGLGIPVARYRRCVLLGSSILAGASTAFCGPVAFIGIAVPHLAYLLFKTTNHRVLVPASCLCGSILAVVASLFPPDIPLNAVLSVVGVPVILYVLFRGAGRGGLYE